MSEQTTPPATLRAGDSAGWSVTLPGYSAADGWQLSYRLLFRDGTAPVDISTTADGPDHVVAITAATSAAWPAGGATLAWWVTLAAARVTLGSQSVTILPDLATATDHDPRSHNQRALDDAKAALAAYLKSGRGHVESYEVAGRSMKFRSVDEVRDLVNHFTREVTAERHAALALQGIAAGRIVTRF